MANETLKVTPDTLNDVMEFDRVIYSHGDGETVTVRHDVYAPGLLDDEIDSHPSGWQLWSAGYTGQYGYNGPIMHDSEFIGGRMARDILETRGYFVALVSYYSTCPECETDDEGETRCSRCESESFIEGWAIAHREAD